MRANCRRALEQRSPCTATKCHGGPRKAQGQLLIESSWEREVRLKFKNTMGSSTEHENLIIWNGNYISKLPHVGEKLLYMNHCLSVYRYLKKEERNTSWVSLNEDFLLKQHAYTSNNKLLKKLRITKTTSLTMSPMRTLRGKRLMLSLILSTVSIQGDLQGANIRFRLATSWNLRNSNIHSLGITKA